MQQRRRSQRKFADASVLDKKLNEILAVDDLAGRVLPDGGPSYVGADYQVARLRYISSGMEVTIGGNKYLFNSNGFITRIESGIGDKIDLEYDARGQLMAARQGGRSQEFC